MSTRRPKEPAAKESTPQIRAGDAGILAAGRLAELLAIPELPKRLQAVDTRLAGALEEFRRVLKPRVFSFLTAPSKRIRAVLTIAAADLGGVFDKRVVTAATAIELVQMGSLIHDDIIEAAPARRGKPTLNASENVPIALVVGDLVLGEAGVLAAEMHEEASRLLAESMAHMEAGQLDELRDAFSLQRTLDRYRAAVQAKTGALFAGACRLGGICGGLKDRKLEALTDYGTAFGLMYQMVDDILDLVGDPKRLGKPVGMDLATGTYTEPVITALAKRGGKTLASLLKRRRTDALAEALERIKKSGAVDDAEKAVRSLAQEAGKALAPFADHPVGLRLQRFPSIYSDWALQELRAGNYSSG